MGKDIIRSALTEGVFEYLLIQKRGIPINDQMMLQGKTV